MNLTTQILSEIKAHEIPNRAAFSQVYDRYRNFMAYPDFLEILKKKGVTLIVEKPEKKAPKVPHVTKKKIFLEFVAANEFFTFREVVEHVCKASGQMVLQKYIKHIQWLLCQFAKTGGIEIVSKGNYKSNVYIQK